MTNEPDKIDSLLNQTLGDLEALPEHGMRSTTLARRISILASDDIARFFCALLARIKTDKKARAALALIVNPEALKSALGNELFHEVHKRATELRLPKVARLFTDLAPQKSGPAGYDKEIDAQMESISLGERRALSKRNIKESIDQLLSDPDPMVIGNILNNPRTTEREVVKIASKRPGAAEILKLVATHGKWSKRYTVKKALALNPYSPPRVVIVLLESLMAQDLRVVATEESLHEQVQTAAKELLREGPD
jgi:hypothetical protein